MEESLSGGEGLVWVVVVLVGLAAAAVIVAAGLAWDSWRRARQRRELTKRMKGGPARTADPEAGGELLREARGGTNVLEMLAERVPRVTHLEVLLLQADVEWGIGRFLTLSLLAAVLLGAIGLFVVGVPVFGLALTILGGMLPYLWLRRKKKKRIERFEENLPEAIDLLGRAVRAGHAVSTGFQMVADEIGGPVSEEFRIVFEEQRYGLPMEESLFGLLDRVDSMDVKIFVTAVMIQREVGGNLAEILDNISRTIRERFKIQRQVRVHTAQGRMTGYLLAALPVVVGSLIYALNPGYMSVLFEPGIGRLLISVAVLLQIMGFVVIRRIVTIEV